MDLLTFVLSTEKVDTIMHFAAQVRARVHAALLGSRAPHRAAECMQQERCCILRARASSACIPCLHLPTLRSSPPLLTPSDARGQQLRQLAGGLPGRLSLGSQGALNGYRRWRAGDCIMRRWLRDAWPRCCRTAWSHHLLSRAVAPFLAHIATDAPNPLTPQAFTMNNTYGTHVLLEAARKVGTIRRFINVSTDEVRALLLPPANLSPSTVAAFLGCLIMPHGRLVSLLIPRPPSSLQLTMPPTMPFRCRFCHQVYGETSLGKDQGGWQEQEQRAWRR